MRRTQVILPGLALAATLAAGWLRTQVQHKEIRLFPGRPAYLFSYDDRSRGGVSEARNLERIDDGIRFTFRLGPSRSAYAGAGADLSGPGRNRKGIDLSRFDALDLDLRTRTSLSVKVILTGFDSTIWKEGDYLSRRYSEARIEVPSSGRVHIPLDRFVLPGWWLDQGLAPLTDTTRSLNMLQTIEVQAVAGNTPPNGSEDTILVRDVRATRDRSLAGAWIWTIPGLLGAAALGRWVLSRRKARLSRPSVFSALPASRTADPVPLSLGNESDAFLERLTDHLARNYQRSQLDADTVCRETGIPRSRLPEIVKAGFGTTFKAHLNELRLKEAARLLRATDRGVGEIGFAVGYNSVPHFHRVFRDKYGVPPGEYRLAGKVEEPSGIEG